MPTIQTMSKAIAGGIASMGAAWVAALWGFQIPAEAIEWTSALIATGIAYGMGHAIVWLSPPNRT
jgi:hypothetical protein